MRGGISWLSPSDEFELASIDINLASSSSSEYRWQLDQRKIDQFQRHATPQENERLRESLSFIPHNALFIS